MRSLLFARSRRSTSRRWISLLAPVLVTTAVIGPVALAPTQAVARASSKLACRASVSNAYPSDYSTVTVYVSTVSNARVTTSAHYKTTTHPKAAKANSSGRASTSYDISDATKGFRVIVTVVVQSGNRSGSCQTSFVPE